MWDMKPGVLLIVPWCVLCSICDKLKDAIDDLNTRSAVGRPGTAQAMKPLQSIERTLDNQLHALQNIENRTADLEKMMNDVAMGVNMPNWVLTFSLHRKTSRTAPLTWRRWWTTWLWALTCQTEFQLFRDYWRNKIPRWGFRLCFPRNLALALGLVSVFLSKWCLPSFIGLPSRFVVTSQDTATSNHSNVFCQCVSATYRTTVNASLDLGVSPLF